MKVSVLGIDLGKNVCSIVGLDGSGAIALRRRVKRETLIGLAAKLSPCIVAMEACCGAHYLGRLFKDQGHDVRLMSPEFVRPYIKAQKNDDRDAEGIAEAATGPTMRFVELKTQEQLDMQTLHRSRIGSQTVVTNPITSGFFTLHAPSVFDLIMAAIMIRGFRNPQCARYMLLHDSWCEVWLIRS